jgi:hypothetical protein
VSAPFVAFHTYLDLGFLGESHLEDALADVGWESEERRVLLDHEVIWARCRLVDRLRVGVGWACLLMVDGIG